MWLGVDPLMEKYTNVSGYVFCHSNPIVRIDRDGCADYFSISGKFIRSDKSKDKNIYIRTSSGNVLLSKYNFKRNLRAMMRITYHYAKEVGLEGKAKSIGVKSMKSNPEGELAITTYDNSADSKSKCNKRVPLAERCRRSRSVARGCLHLSAR